MNAAANVLFLHGGPGLTAELERRQFGASLPVRWWDQPRVNPGAERPFDILVDAAVDEVSRLTADRDNRVDLLASSFGAYLARALIDRVPDRVGMITISGGLWDLSVAILRLGLRFAEQAGDAELETAYRDAATARTPRALVGLLARVSAMPSFLDCYWSPSARELREAMSTLAAEGRLIDWPTCQSVMTAALALPQIPLSEPHPGGVRIVIGRFDPYFQVSDVDAWRTLWPYAKVEIVEAGHFPHLELPASILMPAWRTCRTQNV